MESELRAQKAPRMTGKGPVFDEYLYKGSEKGFYELFIHGKNIKTAWVNKSDFERSPRRPCL